MAAPPGVIRLVCFRATRLAMDSRLRAAIRGDLVARPGLLDLYLGRQGPEELGPRLVASIWESEEAMSHAVEAAPGGLERSLSELDGAMELEVEWLPLRFGSRFARREEPGVLRLVHGTVRSGELEPYVAAAEEGTLADAAAGHGPMALYLAATPPDSFVTLSVWHDWSTLQTATGGRLDQPIATRHAERLVAWRADHFEVISLA